MCKVIFLDIDGVLNNSESIKKNNLNKYGFDANSELLEIINDFDMNCVKNLKKVMDEIDAVAVITSTLKDTYLYPFVIKFLLECGIKVVDKTRDFNFNKEKEILDYLKRHYVPNYVIIDDDFAPENDELYNNVVTTYYDGGGFTEETAKEVLAKFAGKTIKK